MAASATHLELSEIEEIVNAILADKLGAYGFSHVEIEPRRDEDDKEFLFIRSVFGPSRQPFTGEQSVWAIHAAIQALVARGEDRFPLIVHKFLHAEAA